VTSASGCVIPKDRSLAPYVFTCGEWAAFLAGIRDGEFDLPVVD